MDFREVDSRYFELKQRYESGALTDEEFAKLLKELMVQDGEGRWWAKSRQTGTWHYHDGTRWVKATPPDYEPPSQTKPTESAPTPESRSEQVDQPPSEDRSQEDRSAPTQADRPAEEHPPVRTPPREDPSHTQREPTEQHPSQSLRPEGTPERRSGWRAVGMSCLVVLALSVLVPVITFVAYLDTGGDTGGSSPPDRVDPAPDPGDIFQDDFESVSKKNWDTDKEENFAIKYSDDALKLSTEPSSSVAELKGEDAGKPLDVDDVSVEADITQVSDNTDGEASWGLVCRAEDYDNYYVALLWSNGDVIISKVKNDNFADPLDNADGSEAFDGSTATNHIRFDCVGKTLTMYLNDQEVAKAKDSTFATGTIGLSVNSDDTSSKVEASFDNLLVSSP